MVLSVPPFHNIHNIRQDHQGGVALQEQAYPCSPRPSRESVVPQCNSHDVDLGKPCFPFHYLERRSSLREEAWRLELLVDGIDTAILSWVIIYVCVCVCLRANTPFKKKMLE